MTGPPDAPARLISVLRQLLAELRGRAPAGIALDDDLERGLGIDSLARTELMLRLEREFGVHLDEVAVHEAATPRDLLRALASSAPPGAIDAGVRAPVARKRAGRHTEPRDAATLIDVLEARVRDDPEHVHLTLLDDPAPATTLTTRALFERAASMAAGLQAEGLAPGESVALMLPTSLAFFETFVAIMLAGAVPVPIYPPFRASQIEDHLRRQARILDNAHAVVLVTDARTQRLARLLRGPVPSLRSIATVEQLAAGHGSTDIVRAASHDTALLQYTSGSTGQPKGVVLSHANLLANIRAMGAAVEAGPDDVFVSWLPLYHDMGLIGAWMGSLYHGLPLVLMPPQAFLARPSRWLWAVHRHRATLSAAPNFAYEMLATRVPDVELEGLDLSSWRVAFNGAEPVAAATLERFAARFAAHGFDPRAMTPVYGLAESGVGLAFPPLRRGPRIDCISRDSLQGGGSARQIPCGDEGSMRVVSCGLPLAGHEIRVVDARGGELPERAEGRIEFRGPSATSGYFRNPQASRALFDGDWLDTGDVGYMAEGELYPTSRVKDLIIRGGHNIHPYDLEDAVGKLAGVRKGCVAVFGASDPADATERIVVLAETRDGALEHEPRLRERIRELSIELLGVPADDVVLAGAHVVPKTSSGKIRRAACRELYERGVLREARRGLPAWVQLGRLQMSALAGRARNLAGRCTAGLDAAALWTLFCLLALAGAVALACLPTLRWRRRAVRALARAMRGASILPLQVEGAAHLAGGGPRVFVANHASYADWLLLIATLPADVAFVAKRELGQRRALAWLLGRVGTRFVERGESRQAAEDTRRLVQAVRAGESLVFFPEGTLSRAPGLQPFHLGAFVVSARSGAPLVPVTLRGTRSLLRDGSWWPRRHPLAVRIDAPLRPQGSGWSDALALRDAARRRIASACAEPDIGEAPPGAVEGMGGG